MRSIKQIFKKRVEPRRPDGGFTALRKTSLHIGTTKTGSSSIQSFLSQNRETLQSQKILYPHTLGEVSHTVIPALIAGRYARTNQQALHGVASQSDYLHFGENRRNSLALETEEMSAEHVVISSEHMQSRCNTGKRFAALKRLLAPVLDAEEIEIVVFLRPQIDHIISLYSTYISHGGTRAIDQFVVERLSHPHRRYFDYQWLVQTWTNQFPRAKIIVRSFNAAKRLPQGVVTDFADVANIDTARCVFPHRINTSLDAGAIELLRLANCSAPSLTEQEIKIFKTWLRRRSRKDNRLAPQIEISRKFQAVFEQGNSWLLENFLPHEPSALTPNWDALSQASGGATLSEKDARAAIKTALEEHTAPRIR